ncbi:putative low-complexity protein [Candidatus Nitrososphaera evergladensis SR1]|uniref:Putative low-complexity protein n=2 Tax=Nitrososphaera TaxID=497726 RepID=A0A075MRJ0_9ARCH|nr:putative low-complexity protein [Candidatus Nitrososphaera evergladensis SR1]
MPYGLKEGTIEKVQFQTAWTGDSLDDLAIYTREPSMKLVLQIKNNLEFSPGDKTFIKVLKSCWSTFKKDTFDPKKEWYGIGLGIYQKNIDSHLQQLLNWARDSGDSQEFFQKVKAFDSQGKKRFVKIFEEGLKKASGLDVIDDSELFDFLKNLVVLYYDVKPEGKDRTWSINYLRQIVKDGTPQESILLFNHLVQTAAKYSASAGTLTLESLRQEIPYGIIQTDHKAVFDTVSYRKRLLEYLRFVEGFRDYTHELDKKPLKDYYLQNRAVVQDVRKWEEESSVEDGGNNWRIDKFLESGDWYLLVGAEFGIGKTSMMRMAASKLATAFLKKKEGFIPVLAFFKDKLRNVYYKENLDYVISTIVAPRQFSNKTHILLILDGLDEYGEDIEDLLLRLDSMHQSYPLMKVIITTRMNAGYPRLLEVDKFVRLLPFSKEEVDSFFDRYGVSLSYGDLSDFGLRDEEKAKPLFCWMMAVISSRTSTEIRMNKTLTANTRRALIYQEFIHSLLRGKYREEAKRSIDGFHALYVQEKKILRKIAALKQMTKGELTEVGLKQDLAKFGLVNWSQDIEPILTSYFTLRTDGLYKMVDFIHESFKEYLVAEYYIESILEGHYERLYVDMPSKETLSYLEGLVELLRNDSVRDQMGEIADMFLKSLSHGTPPNIITYSSFCNVLDSLNIMASKCFEDRDLVIGEKGAIQSELWSVTDGGSYVGKSMKDYESLWLHRWIAAYILNRLCNLPEKEELERLVKFTSHQMPNNIKEFKDAKLSRINFENANFSKSNFENAIFYGAHLTGCNFSHSNLRSTRFFGATMVGTSLDHSDCEKGNMTDANLTGANLSYANLRGAKLSNAILDSVNFGSLLVIEDGKVKAAENNGVVNLQDATLNGVKIRATVISNIELKGTNLSQCDLRSSDIVRVRLTEVNLFKSNLQNCKIVWCTFSGPNTDLSYSNLSTSIIIESNLSGCNLKNAVLLGAHLDKVDLTDADLRGADLRGTYLGRLKIGSVTVDENTKTEGVILHSADYFKRFDKDIRELIEKQNKQIRFDKRDRLKSINIIPRRTSSFTAEEMFSEVNEFKYIDF